MAFINPILDPAAGFGLGGRFNKPTAEPVPPRQAPGETPGDRVTLQPGVAAQELTPQEKQIVEELQARDREVRAHERAHKVAAGPFAKGGPNFTYQTGPDGKRYAVGGEVQIDTAPVPGDPEATIRKARVIQRAANAPLDPSPQDRRVAAQASSMERQARVELAQERKEEGEGLQQADAETEAPSPSPLEPNREDIPDTGFSNRVRQAFSPETPTSGNHLNLFI